MEKEKLSLMVDYAFKRVFAQEGSKTILKDFLESILKIEIREIEIKNPEMPKDMKDSKIGILDIKAKINENTTINIEMQMVNQKNIDKRSTYYMTKIHAEDLNEGEEYITKSKTIVINILNFNYYKRNTYHSIARMKFEKGAKETYVNMGYEKEEELATNDLEMHFIELPKFKKKNPDVQNRLEQWLCLIIGEGEKAEMAKEKNKEIKKADEILDKLSQSREERELYELRMKAIRDEANIRRSGYEDGYDEGVREKEKELEELRKKAILDEANIRRSGYEDGYDEGVREKEKELEEIRRKEEEEIERNKEIVKNMLKKKIPLEDIMEITGLTEEEIKNLNF